MTLYRATIVSPKGATPTSSVIEFESEHRAGSKQNVQDARYKMLELHGAEALSLKKNGAALQSSSCLIFVSQLSHQKESAVVLSAVLRARAHTAMKSVMVSMKDKGYQLQTW